MISDPLRGVSDATIALCGAWALGGWLLGFVTAVFVWWRPITRARHDRREIRRLQMALEDADRQLSGQFGAAQRMARMLVEEASKR
jgi:hypothetical protein